MNNEDKQVANNLWMLIKIVGGIFLCCLCLPLIPVVIIYFIGGAFKPMGGGSRDSWD